MIVVRKNIASFRNVIYTKLIKSLCGADVIYSFAI